MAAPAEREVDVHASANLRRVDVNGTGKEGGGRARVRERDRGYERTKGRHVYTHICVCVYRVEEAREALTRREKEQGVPKERRGYIVIREEC